MKRRPQASRLLLKRGFLAPLCVSMLLACVCPQSNADPGQSDSLRTITASEFEQTVLAPSQTRPVVAEFFATWCAPCKFMELTLRAAARSYRGKVDFVRIDVDTDEKLAHQLDVPGVPTIVVFENGIAMGRIYGAVS